MQCFHDVTEISNIAPLPTPNSMDRVLKNKSFRPVIDSAATHITPLANE